MNIKMKVRLYKVRTERGATPLVDLLQQISRDVLPNRVRRIGYNDLRLENILAPRSAANDTDYWMLDFVKMRMDHGPGKVGVNTAIEGFQLQDDEGFGEETAVLYDPVRQFMVVQYNHHGVKGANIERYLTTYEHDDTNSAYSLEIKLDDTSEAKLANKNFITKLQFKIAPNQITASHLTQNVSLERAIELSGTNGSNTVELTISAARGENLFSRNINSLVLNLQRWVQADAAQNTQAVTQFMIDAKANLADRAEKIDMLMPALELVLDGIVMGGDRRYTLQSRIEALLRARRGWRSIIGS